MAPPLRPHPLLGILPPPTKTELEVATERVRAYGQRDPIEVLDGQIVAGIDEHRACVAAGVAPKLTKIKRPECLVDYVCRRCVPRHLSTLDRACIAVLAMQEYKRLGRERMREGGRISGLRRSGAEASTFTGERWFESAARVLGTNPTAVKRLASVREHAPDVFDAVRARRLVVLRDAVDLARALPTPRARERVLARVDANEDRPFGRIVADAMRSERRGLSKTASQASGRSWVLHEGPLEREGAKIQDETIDLVVADIVYGDASMAEEVARLSLRVLVNGGVLAMIAGSNGRSVIAALNAAAKHLNPIAVGSYLLRGNSRARWIGPVKRVDSLPVLVFGKGRVRPVAHLAYESMEKDEAQAGWSKNAGAMLALIQAMVPPGSRVLDPCVGSGTTGVAALVHRCEFVGIDVDPHAVSESGARLAEVERALGTERRAAIR